MKKNPPLSDLISPFMIIVFAAICIQLAGRYHASQTLVFKKYFYSLWIILRIAVPVILIRLLKIPFHKVGLTLPILDRKVMIFLSIAVLFLLVSFAGIYFYQDYIGFYSHSFHSAGSGSLQRFTNFMIFTSSTLIGWEFLHRGLLLLGLKYILTEKEGVNETTAITMSIAVVWIFEVVYHFIKPGIEALGLLIGSPILSYLAIRTRSILLPFLLHLFVEILFIVTLIIR